MVLEPKVSTGGNNLIRIEGHLILQANLKVKMINKSLVKFT